MLYRGLPDAVRRFEADYPSVEIVLSEMNTQAQVQAIQRGQIDLGYAHWGHCPPEVESAPVYAEPFVCCLPAAHPLARRRQVTLAALAAEPFILFPRDAAPHYHDLIIAQCVNAGFSPLIRHEARLWQTILSMIEFGMGIALVPRVLQQVKSDRLAFRPLKDASLESRTLELKRSGTAEPVALRFADYVRASIDALPALAG
jgi:DNA-binding transcriptional LysR family regulator